MPIEIKELYIKINVNEGPNKETANSSKKESEGKETIIATAVEEVMDLMNKQKER